MDNLSPLAMYSITGGFGLVVTLIGVVFKIMRDEQDRHRAQLELKATQDQLKEVKVGFQQAMDRQHEDYQERLKLLEQRQEREIDILNERMSEIKISISEMRKEQSNSNERILQHLQSITVAMRQS